MSDRILPYDLPAKALAAGQIKESDVQFLWDNDYWDGPLEGVAQYKGEKVYFAVIDINSLRDPDDEGEWWRKFALIRLTPEQLEKEVYWHEQFCEHVGTHCTYAPQPEGINRGRPCTSGEYLGSANADKFYVPYKQRVPPDFSTNEILGWIEL